MKYQNPKALNLEDLAFRNTKVILGLKCNPILKLRLAQEASLNGLTLSAFTEKLLFDYIEKSDKENQELEILNSKIINLRKRLKFYESPVLEKLLTEHRDEEHFYTNIEGKRVNIRLTNVQDVFTLVINQFR
jgi:hypothetical protein